MKRSSYLLSLALFGQSVAFEVASVKPCENLVGLDYNNSIKYSPTGFTGRHVTLARLITEAYGLQSRQVLGPTWLDQAEYDIDAKTGGEVDRERMSRMLQTLLTDRFKLVQHLETRPMRGYDLVVDRSGAKIEPASGDAPDGPNGRRFHGTMRQFANFLAIRLTSPILDDPTTPGRASGPPVLVLDKTGLTGTYDFAVPVTPELGTPIFTLLQRMLQGNLGLTMEPHKGDVEVLVVDRVERVPVEN